jgi:hypothetical protein
MTGYKEQGTRYKWELSRGIGHELLVSWSSGLPAVALAKADLRILILMMILFFQNFPIE